MGFDPTQQSHCRFRQILKDRTAPVVVWAGAGLSAPAKLPTWPSLLNGLLEIGEDKLRTLDAPAQRVPKYLLQLAQSESSMWLAFDHLRRALGEATWTSSIRSMFEASFSVMIPQMYLDLWGLTINGFFTLNIDRLVARAFSSCFPGRALREFTGTQCQFHSDVLRSGQQFVANLHGTLESDESWVFTQKDFDKLSRLPAYTALVQTCFASRVVLFAGISAEDQAAGGHLQKLKAAGISLGGHFWLTNRSDKATDEWAEAEGVNRIYYTATGEDHSELKQFIRDLKEFVQRDENSPPIVPSVPGGARILLPSPENLEKLSANEIRI